MVIKKAELFYALDIEENTEYVDPCVPKNKEIFCSLEDRFYFNNREYAEDDTSTVQIIPYVIIRNNKGQLLSYPRSGTERRLHNLFSIGFGGHIDFEDSIPENEPYDETFEKTLLANISRELEEELYLKIFDSRKLEMLGFLYDGTNSVGKVHFGLVHVYNVTDDFELVMTEEVKEKTWVTLEHITDNLKDYETWSRLAYTLL